jgi:uncharacterized protein with GYD domain
MRLQSFLLASAIAIGLSVPATAQQPSSSHRYAVFFKYSDQAIKAMMDNPQDRAAPIAKLLEAFGGKMESVYFFPVGGEFDAMAINQVPGEAVNEALAIVVRSSGNIAKLKTLPLMTAEEFKAAMERAKQGVATYTAPTTARQ